MKKEVIAHKDPKSPISEIFRTLRTNIQFMSTSSKLKTLLVTSTFPSEGKSWVVSNLAVTFAQAGKRVILVDADMRKGRQYTIFGVSPRPGLSNYLSGVDINDNEGASREIGNYIQETDVDNLYLMPAGNIPPNPSELLVSSQMNRLLEELKEICDIVIIDGTPCELVTDSIILARLVDSTLIVTAHKETKKDALERVIRNIQNVGGKIAGVVINKMPITSKKYSQTYKYYGSSDGKKRSSSSRFNSSSIYKKINIKSGTSKDLASEIKKETSESNEKIIVENETENENAQQVIDLPKEEKEEKNEEVLEIPKALQGNIKIENSHGISEDKTNDILKQINEYLDNEKKNLK